MRTNTVAMILAGGRGSRLYDLTNKIAKPAVHFGGKYRIIDFPISNCVNSNINKIGILVQYESVLLSSYVSKDAKWGLDTKDAGICVLAPREKDEAGLSVYRGTADAITQNIDYLDQEDAEYVLILSGDHIYKMDYDAMLQEHIKNKADATIAVLEVPMKEASRFGIMNCDKEDRIVEFEEKPAKPKSNLASMGIYIFSYKTLRKYLKADEKNDLSNHDFGKDIIPSYLNDGKKLMAYRFKGYWKDVGTVDSLWEANMDLIDDNSGLDLFEDWKIYTEDVATTPQFLGPDAKIKDSYITQGVVVNGSVEHSVLFTDVQVKDGAKVKDAVVMNGAVIGEGASISRCIVDEGTKVPAGMKINPKEGEDVVLVTNKLVAEKAGK